MTSRRLVGPGFTRLQCDKQIVESFWSLHRAYSALIGANDDMRRANAFHCRRLEILAFRGAILELRRQGDPKLEALHAARQSRREFLTMPHPPASLKPFHTTIGDCSLACIQVFEADVAFGKNRDRRDAGMGMHR